MFFFIIIAGIYDYKYRIIPNHIIVLLFLVGFFSDAPLIERIAGFLVPAFPLFLLALKFKNINGGDVKYLAALGFVVGIYKLAVILIITTILAYAWQILKKEESIPLATVMAFGYLGGLIF